MYSEEITGIVLDIGSKTIRAGYSGDDTPRFVIPSKCMLRQQAQQNKMEIEGEQLSDLKNKQNNKQNIYNKFDLFFGDEYLNVKKENQYLKDICNQGIIQDYDLLQKTMSHIFNKQLQLNPDQFPLMMSEQMGVPVLQRQKITEMVFESLNATNYFTCKSPVLSSFSCGRSASLVLDSGHSCTWAVPVLDGYALSKNTIKFQVGGAWMTHKVLNYLEKQINRKIHPRFCYQSSVDKEGKRTIEYIGSQNLDQTYYDFQKDQLGQSIKEQLLFIDDEELMQKQERNQIELPDGNIVKLGEYRNIIVDSMFESVNKKNKFQDGNYQIENLEQFKGIHNMAIDSINSCDIDVRKDLLNNVLLVGGNTLIPGLDDLFNRKFTEVAPQNSKVKIITHPTSLERYFAPWIGASILSSLGSFQNMWIGKQEYEEHGSYIINKKCP